MKERRVTYFIDLLLRIIIGIAFIYSGGIKLLDLESFAATIEAFGLVPELFSYPLGIMLPLIEVIAGTGLIVGNKESLYTITSLLFLFLCVLIYGILKGIDVDCGCYGPNDPVSTSLSSLKTSLVRDLIMISCILFMFYYRFSEKREFMKILKEEKNE
ncbi:MAG: DoxX family membrane protein [Desulfobacterales bacterium]|nr:DoxX family membrane protein [Desulfobacterales bacterium]MCP4161821.1 DoxX family membrane protein [Deltaproteobacteria bacterium]